MALHEDIKKSATLIDNGGYKYQRISARSSEDVSEILKGTYFEDKEVLSFLGSSDYPFMAYYMGAKNVDTFDINPLTKYYYYLRKWALVYRGILDPSEFSNKWFLDLFDDVTINSEEDDEAYNFWLNLFMEHDELMDSRLFSKYDPYYTIDCDVEKLSRIIARRNANFKDIDLFDYASNDKKYGVVIMSNIFERTVDVNRLKICFDNLSSILDIGGIVICTHGINREISPSERKLFSSSFMVNDYNDLYSYNNDSAHYTYTKVM